MNVNEAPNFNEIRSKNDEKAYHSEDHHWRKRGRLAKDDWNAWMEEEIRHETGQFFLREP